MILVNLKGGIGNQMFQYAAGLALAEKKHTPIKLDIYQLLNTQDSDVYTKRDFELGIFNVSAETATPEERRLYLEQEKKIWYRIRRKLLPALIKRKIFREPSLHYFPEINEQGNNVYLDGYFQSEKYFSHCKEKIRKEFTFREELTGLNAVNKELILDCNAVSIHVRCGDYLKKINLGLFGGICTPEYYKASIAHIEAKIEKPVFFVFSDDPVIAAEIIGSKKSIHFITGNQGNTSYNDMRLMSLCKHHIIANSSFSWWGAWLNKNENKIVLAPKKWLNDPNCKIEDILLPEWIKK